VAFVVRAPGVEELATGEPEAVVRENALRKARAVTGALVLGVDTVVALEGELHGKPPDEAAARRALARLSGRTHEVWGGVAVVRDGEPTVAAARTAVTFRDLHDAELDWYLAQGEWRERAGGYAIQGAGAALVQGIEGDFWNVVGLPVALLLELVPDLLAGAT